MIVLDTHAWIWLVDDPDRLGKGARRALASSRLRAVAAISCWEVAFLAARERVVFDRDTVTWMEDALAAEGIEILPLTPAVAAVGAQLQKPRDPADRQIIASALVHGADLVTVDETIAKSGLVRTIW